MKTSNLKVKPSKNPFYQSDIAVLNEKEKQRILLNNLKLMFFLNLFPFIGILFSLIYYKWYKLEISNIQSFWFHLLFVYDDSNGQKYFFSEFINSICKQYHELVEKNGCSFYKIFELSGIISFFFIILGLVVYFMFLVQILMVIKKKGKFLSKCCFKQKTKLVFALVSNFLGLFFWVFISILTEFSFEKIGISVYILLIASLLIIPLLGYYLYLKGCIKTENLVASLLDPEQVWKEDFK